MAYTQVGEGPPLVLIHGFPLNKGMWDSQVAHLKQRFRVLAPDLRGHGETEVPQDAFSMDLFANDVIALVGELGLGPAVFVGHSMGGYVLFRLYAQQPDSARALVFANTRAEADGPEARKKRLDTIGLIQKSGPEAFMTDFARKLLSESTKERRSDLLAQLISLMKYAPAHGIIASLRALAERSDSRTLLSDIQVPTLLIAGKEDSIIPLQSMEDMQKRLQDSRLIVIPETGHMSNMESPQVFNEEVDKFLMNVA